MKKLFTTQLFLLILITANAQWTQLNSGTTQNLHAVDFYNFDYGLAGGDSGTVLLTTDGGANWYPINAGGFTSIGDVHVVNRDTFLVSMIDINGHPEIMYTFSGGLYWQPVAVDTMCFLPLDIDSRSNGKWFSTGNSIVSSSNQGNSWDTLAQFTCGTTSITRLAMADAMTINAGGLISGIITYSAYMYRSEDGGNIMHACDPLSFPNADALTAFHFPYPDTGFIFMNHFNHFSPGTQNTLVKTFNYHSVFSISDTVFEFSSSVINPNMPGFINDGYFSDYQNGFAASSDGNIYETMNGGNSWLSTYNTNGKSLNRISFPDDYTGYAVGDSGIILKYRPSNQVKNENKINNVVLYPNPANDIFFVKGIPHSANFNYSIKGMQGNIIRTGKLNPSGNISVNDLSNGTYLVELMSHETVARKIFLIQR